MNEIHKEIWCIATFEQNAVVLIWAWSTIGLLGVAYRSLVYSTPWQWLFRLARFRHELVRNVPKNVSAALCMGLCADAVRSRNESADGSWLWRRMSSLLWNHYFLWENGVDKPSHASQHLMQYALTYNHCWCAFAISSDLSTSEQATDQPRQPVSKRFPCRCSSIDPGAQIIINGCGYTSCLRFQIEISLNQGEVNGWEHRWPDRVVALLRRKPHVSEQTRHSFVLIDLYYALCIIGEQNSWKNWSIWC